MIVYITCVIDMYNLSQFMIIIIIYYTLNMTLHNYFTHQRQVCTAWVSPILDIKYYSVEVHSIVSLPLYSCPWPCVMCLFVRPQWACMCTCTELSNMWLYRHCACRLKHCQSNVASMMLQLMDDQRERTKRASGTRKNKNAGTNSNWIST